MTVRSYTDSQIVSRVESTAKGFTGWADGMYAICVRSNEDTVDRFDDKLYLFRAAGGKPVFVMVANCTTHPGADVLRNYARKYNPAGAPVMLSDQIVYRSHAYGLHQGKYAAYRQVKPIPYVRDRDGDLRAEDTGTVQRDIIMMNVHRASATRVSDRIVNWSAGCIVMNDPQAFKQFMDHMKKQPLTVCILKEWQP